MTEPYPTPSWSDRAPTTMSTGPVDTAGPPGTTRSLMPVTYVPSPDVPAAAATGATVPTAPPPPAQDLFASPLPTGPTGPAGFPAPGAAGYPASGAAGGPLPAVAAGPGARLGMRAESSEGGVDLDAALRATVEVGASDLHLTSGTTPMVRVNGALRPLDGFAALTSEALQRSIFASLTQRQRDQFDAELELDLALAVPGLARFRVNLYRQRESIGGAFRLIPHEIKPLEELGMPSVVGGLAGLPRGLVLVTGPTGSGKSTTLASIIDLANRTRNDHIMTVEDPIEFLHRHKGCLVNQREVGADTLSFASALKHALRQDPDIILVGELRDLETMSVALTAAETGHLVFATLHTQDAAQTIDRIIDVFPAGQHAQVRTQLAGATQAVVSQSLCRTANGLGRVVATEVMLATPAIRNLIREGKTHQISSAMQSGADHGMHTLDQSLARLVREGRITYETGLEKARHVDDYNNLAGRSARMNQGASAMSALTTSGLAAPGHRMPGTGVH